MTFHLMTRRESFVRAKDSAPEEISNGFSVSPRVFGFSRYKQFYRNCGKKLVLKSEIFVNFSENVTPTCARRLGHF